MSEWLCVCLCPCLSMYLTAHAQPQSLFRTSALTVVYARGCVYVCVCARARASMYLTAHPQPQPLSLFVSSPPPLSLSPNPRPPNHLPIHAQHHNLGASMLNAQSVGHVCERERGRGRARERVCVCLWVCVYTHVYFVRVCVYICVYYTAPKFWLRRHCQGSWVLKTSKQAEFLKRVRVLKKSRCQGSLSMPPPTRSMFLYGYIYMYIYICIFVIHTYIFIIHISAERTRETHF